ncbi:MAG: hypothetical protein GY799_32665 [Desulfobulbaceae bacterium]|nr:hypothetical protein [Desulfobulbaceae bacterium]
MSIASWKVAVAWGDDLDEDGSRACGDAPALKRRLNPHHNQVSTTRIMLQTTELQQPTCDTAVRGAQVYTINIQGTLERVVRTRTCGESKPGHPNRHHSRVSTAEEEDA